jgi:proteasome accessory factor A
MNKRPLVNTRDEPHADPSRYRRFHVIVGDSNMSEWATALKIGTTALVLDLIERGEAPQLEIAQPVNATKSISRDPDYAWIIELGDGRKISAVDVQRLYLKAAERLHSGDSEISWLLRQWENVLNDLERDVSATADRVDWAAKKFLLSSFRDEEKLSWNDPWLQSIDLEYHNIQPDEGLFYDLQRQGSMRTLISEKEIKDAIFSPPETTRAWFRGRAVARFNHAISAIQWDEIAFSNGRKRRVVALPEPGGDERLDGLNELVNAENEFEEFFKALDRS